MTSTLCSVASVLQHVLRFLCGGPPTAHDNRVCPRWLEKTLRQQERISNTTRVVSATVAPLTMNRGLVGTIVKVWRCEALVLCCAVVCLRVRVCGASTHRDIRHRHTSSPHIIATHHRHTSSPHIIATHHRQPHGHATPSHTITRHDTARRATRTHAHSCTRTCARMRTDTHVHTSTHSNTHTHTHARARPRMVLWPCHHCSCHTSSTTVVPRHGIVIAVAVDVVMTVVIVIVVVVVVIVVVVVVVVVAAAAAAAR
jgi:hypothetical protein